MYSSPSTDISCNISVLTDFPWSYDSFGFKNKRFCEKTVVNWSRKPLLKIHVLKNADQKWVVFCFVWRNFTGLLRILLLHAINLRTSLCQWLPPVLSCADCNYTCLVCLRVVCKTILNFSFYHFNNRLLFFSHFCPFYLLFFSFKLYHNASLRHRPRIDEFFRRAVWHGYL